jgi:hypothetical protein
MTQEELVGALKALTEAEVECKLKSVSDGSEEQEQPALTYPVPYYPYPWAPGWVFYPQTTSTGTPIGELDMGSTDTIYVKDTGGVSTSDVVVSIDSAGLTWASAAGLDGN